MALTNIAWGVGAGDDIHLVPGLDSPRLDQLLWITADTKTVRGDQPPPGVTVTFSQSFMPTSPGCGGVVVNSQSGIVTVGSGLSNPPRLLNFLVLANVSEAATSTKLTAYLRVHVHTSIQQVWLTPSTLSVPFGSASVRFSVLAEFEDGSYGDITNWATWSVDREAPGDRLEVQVTATGQRALVWLSDNAAAVDVDPRTGVLTSSVSGTTAAITAVLAQPAMKTTAIAIGADPWATRALPWPNGATLDRLSGPGFSAMSRVPNVLILGDGFDATEQATFRALAASAVAGMQANRRMTPYGLLKDQMNFFAAMVESREVGVSVSNPVVLNPTASTLEYATDLDVSVPPSAAPTEPPIIVTPTQNVSDYLLNERDTAFGVTYGERPRAQRFQEARNVGLSTRRIDEADLDAFLAALVDTSGQKVGHVWKREEKDQGLIVVLARSQHYGGANNHRVGPKPPPADYGHVIGMGVGDADVHWVVPATTGQGYDIEPDPIPLTSTLQTQLVIAHEIAHSFGLGDEYGHGPNKPSRGAIPGSELADADKFLNLQTKSQLLTSNSFDPTLTKWARWPRIAKAGLLATPATKVDGDVTLTLKAGHASPFRDGDIVRVRPRPLSPSPPSDQLEVIGTPVNDQLQLHPMGDFFLGLYPAGSLVFAPVLDSAGQELMLVHASVMAHMTTNPVSPLNAEPTFQASPGVLCPGAEPAHDNSTPALSYGPGQAPNPPKESAWLTGLWERGSGYDCEIYHPTGACLMNVLTADPGKTQAFQFCWVCRYVLVDAIDPTKHGAMDSAISDRYPK